MLSGISRPRPRRTKPVFYIEAASDSMDQSGIIQQLLRPADTCVMVVQGFLLGLPSPEHRLFAVVRHEGTEEHALFMFGIKQQADINVTAFYPIRGTFSAQMQGNQGLNCQVLVDNGQGSSLVLQLPCDAQTAVFITQLSKALYQLNQSSAADSSTAFQWLQGYENCRTGWDRFAKPQPSSENHSGHLIDLGAQRGELRTGFPETWPWSHIITPNSDGKTEIARCESLLDDFDPLRSTSSKSDETSTSQQPQPAPPSRPREPSNPIPVPNSNDNDLCVLRAPKIVELSVTEATPDSSPTLSHRRLSNPFRVSGDFTNVNPFDDSFVPLPHSPSGPELLPQANGRPPHDIRHCTSETNLSKLKKEYQPLRTLGEVEPLVTRSEEDLLSSTAESRHCMVDGDNHRHINGGLESPGRGSSGSQEGVNDPLDYKSRRSRSTDNSPTQLRKVLKQGSLDSNFSTRLDFNSLSGSGKPQTSKVGMRNPEMSASQRISSTSSSSSGSSRGTERGGRRRAGSRIPTLSSFGTTKGKKSKWVSRYRPGVPIALPGESARESIMQAELRHREEEFCNPKQLRVFCGTWNVNGRMPPADLDAWLLEYQVKDGEKHSPPPDIYAVGFQELDLSAQCLISNESTREEPWIHCVTTTLRKAGSYIMIGYHRLVGIMLLVYIKQELYMNVSDVESDFIATGLHGIMGNKGGVGIHFNVFHSSFCFVNTHFSAHMEEVEKRNGEFKILMDKLQFATAEYSYDISQHDMIFWIGDLNYRVQTSHEMTFEVIKAHADSFQIQTLLKHDQLLNEMKRGNVFWDFIEMPIDFKPTYKYDPGTNDWDSSEKHRPPAWCDRILHRGAKINQRTYGSHPALTISDHKPVSALFDASVRVVDAKKEKEVLEEITWRLDKLENDTLPQVDLNKTEFQFRNVRFMIPHEQRLVVTNTGRRPVHISFIPKLDEKNICKPWLEVKPVSAVIQPLEDAVMTLTVNVDEDTAPALNNGHDLLEDILVLHLEKGKDFFITVSGNYLPSCFGSSLETLVHLHTYIREVPVAQLVDLSSSWEQCPLPPPAGSIQEVSLEQTPPPLDIPKELFTMVDFIKRKGAQEEGLFSDGGRTSEIEDIMNMLDTGGRELPGSTYSVASALLTFLAALADPVVPFALHQRCMECYNNTTLCKQVLTQMPKVHRRTFVFLITFMKHLLKFSEANGLDSKVLATIFGEVMLKTPLEERKSRNKRSINAMNRKKATFIYQFLVNDLTKPYN